MGCSAGGCLGCQRDLGAATMRIGLNGVPRGSDEGSFAGKSQADAGGTRRTRHMAALINTKRKTARRRMCREMIDFIWGIVYERNEPIY